VKVVSMLSNMIENVGLKAEPHPIRIRCHGSTPRP